MAKNKAKPKGSGGSRYRDGPGDKTKRRQKKSAASAGTARGPRLGRQILPGETPLRQELHTLGFDPRTIEVYVAHVLPQLEAGENHEDVLNSLLKNPPEVPPEEAPEPVSAPVPVATSTDRSSEILERLAKAIVDKRSDTVPVPPVSAHPQVTDQAPAPKGLEDFAATDPRFELAQQIKKLERNNAGLTNRVERLEREGEEKDRRITSLESENYSFLNEVRAVDRKMSTYREIVHSALEYTEDGHMLSRDRQRLVERLEAGPQGALVWRDNDGKLRVYEWEEAEREVLTLFSRKETEQVKADVTFGLNVNEKSGSISNELRTIKTKIRQIKSRIKEARDMDTIVYGSEAEAAKAKKRRAKMMEFTEQSVKLETTDAEVVGEEETPEEGKFQTLPVQLSVSAARMRIDSLDLAIMRYFTGGLKAKALSKKLGRRVTYTDGKADRKAEFNISDEELEEAAKQGIDLIEDNVRLELTLQEQQRQIEEQRGTIEGLQEGNAGLSQRIGGLQGERDSLQGERDSLQGRVNELAETNKAQGAELEKTKGKLDETETALELSRQYGNQLRGEKGGVEGDLSDTRGELGKTKQELETAQKTLARERDELPGKLEGARREGEAAGYDRAKAEFDEENAKREKRLNKIINEAGKSKSAAARLEAAVKAAREKYNAELARSDAENDEVRGQNARLIEENTGLRNGFEERGRRIDELSQRPTQESVDAQFEDFIDYLSQEWMPVEDAERLLDTHVALTNNDLHSRLLAEERDRQDKGRARFMLFLRGLHAKYRTRIAAAREEVPAGYISEEEAATNAKKELRKELTDSFIRVRKYTDPANPDAIALIDSVRNATLGLSVQGEDSDRDELREIIDSVVSSEVSSDCKAYEIRFITDFYTDKVIEGCYVEQELSATYDRMVAAEARAQLLEGRLADADIRYREGLERERDRRRRELNELREQHRRKITSARYKFRRADKERINAVEAGEARAAELEAEATRTADEHRKELKKERDRLADAVINGTEAEFRHRMELNALQQKVDDLRDRIGDAVIKGVENEFNYRAELNRAYNDVTRLTNELDGLRQGLMQMTNTEMDELLEQSEESQGHPYTSCEGIDALKARVPQELHHLVNLNACYEKKLKQLKDELEGYDGRQAADIDYEGIAQAVREGREGELEENVPPYIWVIIKEAAEARRQAEEARAQAEAAARGAGSRPAGPEQQRFGGERMPYTYGTDTTGLQLWISDKFYHLNGKVGEVRGMLIELRRSLFFAQQSGPAARMGYVEQRTEQLNAELAALAQQIHPN